MGILLLLVSLGANRCSRRTDNGGCAAISNVCGIAGTLVLLTEATLFCVWWFPLLVRGFC